MQARCGRAALLSGGSGGPCFRASPAARGTSTPDLGPLPPPSQLAAWHLCDLVSVITPLSLSLFSAIRGSVSPKAGPPLVEEPRWRLSRRVTGDTSRPRLRVFSRSHCSRGAVRGAGGEGICHQWFLEIVRMAEALSASMRSRPNKSPCAALENWKLPELNEAQGEFLNRCLQVRMCRAPSSRGEKEEKWHMVYLPPYPRSRARAARVTCRSDRPGGCRSLVASAQLGGRWHFWSRSLECSRLVLGPPVSLGWLWAACSD